MMVSRQNISRNEVQLRWVICHRMKYLHMNKVKILRLLMMSKPKKNVSLMNIWDMPLFPTMENTKRKFIFNLAVPLMKISSNI